MTVEHDQMDMPILALRDVVVYPHMVIPLFVGREKSIQCLEVAMENNKQIFARKYQFHLPTVEELKKEMAFWNNPQYH